MPFAWSRKLTFDRTKCGASNLSSFPALVSIADATFGSHVQNVNGYDIVFATDAKGSSLIPWEIEFFDKPTGTLVAWVNIATLNGSSAGTNSFLYLCFGNAAITTPQNTPTQVWDTGYGGVWHLGNGTTLSGNDSTGNVNHASGLNGTAAAAGQIDGGALFNGTSNYINIPNSASMTPTTQMTLSCWVKNANISGLQEYIIKWVSGTFWFLRSNGVNYEFQFATTGICQASNAAAGVWNYVVGTYDGTALRIYVNGLQKSTTAQAGAAAANPAAPVNFGGIGYTLLTQLFNGVMDEPRISNVARSADWILTEYSNQNAPGNIGADNFVIFGPEIAGAVPVAMII